MQYSAKVGQSLGVFNLLTLVKKITLFVPLTCNQSYSAVYLFSISFYIGQNCKKLATKKDDLILKYYKGKKHFETKSKWNQHGLFLLRKLSAPFCKCFSVQLMIRCHLIIIFINAMFTSCDFTSSLFRRVRTYSVGRTCVRTYVFKWLRRAAFTAEEKLSFHTQSGWAKK